MALIRKSFSAATCSWIDPATGLPEVDKSPPRGERVNRGFLVGNFGYRYCNFMEVFVDLNTSGDPPVVRGFTADSGIYRGPSFARIPSHAFSIQQDSFREEGATRFTQVVGARTVSPEVIATGAGVLGGAVAGAWAGGAAGTLVTPLVGTALGALGGAIVGAFGGEILAHQVIGFPPIWSKIQIRIYDDGRLEAQVLQHSLFPSLTFYRQQLQGKEPDPVWYERVDYSSSSAIYDADKRVELPAWQARGWGDLEQTAAIGACGGNPWGIRKGVVGSGVDPN